MSGDREITVNSETLIATPCGALFWPDKETLIVSDLHLEKGSHFAMRGVFLPPYDTRATLLRTAKLFERLKPKTVISLGDAFHDGEANLRMETRDAELLASLIGATKWVWVLGNHDPDPPARFSGAVERTMRLGRLIFRHESVKRPEPGEIAGHYHPVAKVRVETRAIRRRCFATDGERMIMPAYGAYAGGLNILDEAYDGVFRKDLTVWILSGAGVYPFDDGALLPDTSAQRRRVG